MQKQIKQIGLDEYGHLGIVFTDDEIKTYGIVNNDKIEVEEPIKDDN